MARPPGSKTSRTKVDINFNGFSRVVYKSEVSFKALDFRTPGGKRKVLRRAGAIGRGIMRRIFRFRKNSRKHAPVGQPPFSHTKGGGRGLKQLVRFEMDNTKPSVAIGVELRPEIKNKCGAEVPHTLDKGGYVFVSMKGLARSKYSRKYTQSFRAHIGKRPFLRPTLMAMKATYPELWKNWLK